MANALAPFGLKPVRSASGETRVNTYTVSSASARIYEGDLVEFSSGLVIKSTGTTAVTALGVAARGSGAITGQITGFPVYDDPSTEFHAQANASAGVTTIGTRVALNQGTATVYNDISVQTVDALVTSTSYPLLILGYSQEVGNDTGGPNQILRVKIASHLMNA